MADEEASDQIDVKDTEEQVEETEEAVEEVEEEAVEEPKHENDVPYERFKEVVDEKNTLRGLTETLSNLVSQNRGLTPQDKAFEWPEDVDVNTRNAVEKYYQQNIGKEKAVLDQVLGAVLEKLDEVKATSANPQIKKFAKEVDGIRKEYSNSGAYLTREQAFEIAVTRGLVKKTSTGKIIVSKSNPIISKEKTNNNLNSTKNKVKKSVQDMSDTELETSMDNVKF